MPVFSDSSSRNSFFVPQVLFLWYCAIYNWHYFLTHQQKYLNTNSRNINASSEELLIVFFSKVYDLIWSLQYVVIILPLIQAFKIRKVYFPLTWKRKSRKGFIFFNRLFFFFLREINITVDLLQLNNLLLMHKIRHVRP